MWFSNSLMRDVIPATLVKLLAICPQGLKSTPFPTIKWCEKGTRVLTHSYISNIKPNELGHLPGTFSTAQNVLRIP